MASYIKDPDALLDYKLNWSLWLEGLDTISNSNWIVPTGLTLEANVFNDTTTTAWLSGGDLNTTYKVVNRINTAAGRVEDRTITIRIRNR